MARIVDGEHSDEAVVTQFKSRDAAVGARDPDGFEFRSVEGAHQMKCEDADGSGVTEDRDLAAAILDDDLVEFLPRAVEQLSITLAARQNVFEVAPEQCCVLFGVMLRGVFESKTFHHTNAAFAKGVRAVDRQTGQI